MDPPSPYSDHSTAELSMPAPFVDPPSPYSDHSTVELPMPIPASSANAGGVQFINSDLDGFERDPVTRKWVCTRCDEDFVSKHEARRHADTAAKCTGKKVQCLRCGDSIHASGWSRRRHFKSSKCKRNGRKRGALAYTVKTAFKEL